MYYYRISEGEYDFYEETIICHEKRFSKEEFLNMVNSVPNGSHDFDDVKNHLYETYGFSDFVITASAHNTYDVDSKKYEWK